MAQYRMLIEYDGAAFAGWQLQPGEARTVQCCLERALLRVTGCKTRVRGSGRTDAGVHAEAQVASFGLETRLAPERLLRALNGVLPREVAVRELIAVSADFDALRCARAKRYRYRIWNGSVRSPLRAARFWHVSRRIDLEAVRQAARPLMGEHDFSCFRAAGSDARTSLRRVMAIAVEGEAGGEIAIVLVGSGFLRRMVRNIAGTLIEVGLGRRAADSIEGLLASRDRQLAGPTAPARGLTLEAVAYDEAEPTIGAESDRQTPEERERATGVENDLLVEAVPALTPGGHSGT